MTFKNITIAPRVNSYSGNLFFPGDKSISHRLLLLSLLLNGSFTIKNLPHSRDIDTTLKIIKKLGVNAIKKSQNVTILKNSSSIKNDTLLNLDCENSGTTTRLISGILAHGRGTYILTGDKSLISRPMKRIVEPLSQMGAQISFIGEPGRLPIEIKSTSNLLPINFASKISSAQVKSAILLAALSTKGTTCFTEPFLSRNHTENLLKHLGADISVKNTDVKIKGPFRINGDHRFLIPGDPSSAAYLAIACILMKNSQINLKEILSNKTRTEYIDVLKEMGADIVTLNKKSIGYENMIDLQVKSSKLTGITISKERVPHLIDELPILAIAMAFGTGKSVVTGAKELRFKETDRISNLISALKLFNINCHELDDGFVINGNNSMVFPRSIDCHNDHRLAMTLTILSQHSSKPVEIIGGKCADISFPEFYNYVK